VCGDGCDEATVDPNVEHEPEELLSDEEEGDLYF
jgi:hypothetical protein